MNPFNKCLLFIAGYHYGQFGKGGVERDRGTNEAYLAFKVLTMQGETRVHTV